MKHFFKLKTPEANASGVFLIIKDREKAFPHLLPSRLYCRLRILTESATHGSRACAIHAPTAGTEFHRSLKFTIFFLYYYFINYLLICQSFTVKIYFLHIHINRRNFSLHFSRRRRRRFSRNLQWRCCFRCIIRYGLRRLGRSLHRRRLGVING